MQRIKDLAGQIRYSLGQRIGWAEDLAGEIMCLVLAGDRGPGWDENLLRLIVGGGAAVDEDSLGTRSRKTMPEGGNVGSRFYLGKVY